MSKVVLHIPDRNTPGFPRRLKRAAQFQAQVKADGFTPDLVEQVVNFLADYIEGDNHEQQVELMWDCTEDQFNEMLSALGGSGKQIPPPTSAPTDEASKVEVTA